MKLYSWEKVFTEEKINLRKKYSGVQVFIEFTLIKAFLQLMLSICFFISYFGLKKRNRYFALLLNYIQDDKEKNYNVSIE